MAPRRPRDAQSRRERDRMYLEENRRLLEEHQQRLDERLRQLKERDRRDRERQRLAEERAHPIIERAKAGATYLAISHELGVPVGLVRRVCRQAGVKAPRPQDEATIQRHQQMIERVRAGSSLVAVAKAFGITHERVRQICERAGVRSVCRSYAESAEWRAERNLTIIERVKAGASLVAVSRELGLSPRLVQLVCHQAGVKAQRQSRQRDEATAQRDQQIVEQVRAGRSLVAAGRAFGLSHTAVWHICERAGVRSQSPQGRPRSRA